MNIGEKVKSQHQALRITIRSGGLIGSNDVVGHMTRGVGRFWRRWPYVGKQNRLSRASICKVCPRLNDGRKHYCASKSTSIRNIELFDRLSAAVSRVGRVYWSIAWGKCAVRTAPRGKYPAWRFLGHLLFDDRSPRLGIYTQHWSLSA